MMVAGFGFRQGATLASLRDALAQALAQPALPACGITLLATAEDKAEAPCLRALAAALDLPLRVITQAQMAATPTLTKCDAVRALRGTGSTAEAAALAAALTHCGLCATLLHPRSVSTDRLATCAIATLATHSRNRP